MPSSPNAKIFSFNFSWNRIKTYKFNSMPKNDHEWSKIMWHIGCISNNALHEMLQIVAWTLGLQCEVPRRLLVILSGRYLGEINWVWQLSDHTTNVNRMEAKYQLNLWLWVLISEVSVMWVKLHIAYGFVQQVTELLSWVSDTYWILSWFYETFWYLTLDIKVQIYSVNFYSSVYDACYIWKNTITVHVSV